VIRIVDEKTWAEAELAVRRNKRAKQVATDFGFRLAAIIE
jgi:hypothetical protein